MSTDEKLEKLTDRVDALTHSVELIASMHKDLEANTAANIAEMTAAIAGHQGETAKHLAKMSDAITRLASIAEAHEQRIEDLEQ